MNRSRVLAREAIISAVINAVLSFAFFMAVFGLSQPVAWAALAGDGFPQSFMVALMGSLVPGLLVGTKLRAARAPIVVRAVLIAFAALIVLGGGGWLLLHARAGTAAAYPALAAKIVYGALLGAVVTSAALHLLFQSEARA